MSLITASGLPGGLSSAAAANVSFGSVLQIPANLVNKPLQVRAIGSILLPGGKYQGSLNVGIAGQSNNANILRGSTGIDVSGPPQNLPFSIIACLYCDPFKGYVLDVNCAASIFAQPGVSLATSQSRAVVGGNPNNECAAGFGGGTLSFSSPAPLIVLANFFNSGGTSSNPAASDGSPVLPVITAQLSTFELEY